MRPTALSRVDLPNRWGQEEPPLRMLQGFKTTSRIAVTSVLPLPYTLVRPDASDCKLCTVHESTSLASTRIAFQMPSRLDMIEMTSTITASHARPVRGEHDPPGKQRKQEPAQEECQPVPDHAENERLLQNEPHGLPELRAP